MAYAIAAYHDTGISEGRKFHHLASGRIIREDQALRRWFTEEEIEMMAQAAEDHRASNGNAPRSVYGMIVAEADRIIVPRTIIERTVQYGLANYPELDKSEQYTRAKTHLQEKYGEGGYLKLWMPESPNARRLEELRTILKDREQLDRVFEEVYKELKENVIGK